MNVGHLEHSSQGGHRGHKPLIKKMSTQAQTINLQIVRRHLLING